MKGLIYIIIFLSTLVSCSTSVSLVRIKTVPENAQIAVRTAEDEYKILGKGPLEISTQELYSLGSRMSLLQISKESYKSQSILIVQGRSPENYDLLVQLEKEVVDTKSDDVRARQEKLAKSLTHANNLLFLKRFNEAENLLKNIINDFPHISVAYDLLGNLYYLQKNMKSALLNYEKSFGINPENFETKRMIEKIKQITSSWGNT
jgi:tetratricopeptide (TPR) repeat protein